MNHLWAPWRMSYIKSDKTDKGCIFCTYPEEKNDAENLILFRAEYCFVILNRYPYNNGHLLVVPYAHISTPILIDQKAQQELHATIYSCVAILTKAYQPQGFNIGMNLGEIAGAGIAEHSHYHIVPRWAGDTNFMPVFSETRVMPEHLQETYKTLKPLFDENI